MGHTRRTFLQWSCGLGGVGLALPWRPPQRVSPPSAGRTLVVVQARGGLDPLSLVVPFADPTYRALRPELAIAEANTLPVRGEPMLGWHPRLAALSELHDRGLVATVRQIGHAHADLSHFESEAKWHTGDPVGGVVHTGWLARTVQALGQDLDPVPAITVDVEPSQSFAGLDVPAFLACDALRIGAAKVDDDALLELTRAAIAGERPALRRVAQYYQHALRVTAELADAGSSYRARAEYPAGDLSARLATIARLIGSGRRTAVYHTSMTGFDTHSHQAEHNRPTVGILADLLGELAAALRAFVDDLEAHGHLQRVLILVHSEFGRSVGENCKLGTEHGDAGVAFLIGSGVQPGMHGPAYALQAFGPETALRGMPFGAGSVDYRALYATILERWFGVDSEAVLRGRFAVLDVVRP